MKRYHHDLSHHIMTVMKISQLQTLARFDVLPNDTFSIDIDSLVRMSTLRRQIVFDCQLDFFAFYQPHRHIYGDTFQKVLKKGFTSIPTGIHPDPPDPADPYPPFPTYKDQAVDGNDISKYRCYLGYNHMPKEYPLHYIQVYYNIYNRFFKDPRSPDIGIMKPSTYKITGYAGLMNCGEICCNLPNRLSTINIDHVLSHSTKYKFTNDLINLDLTKAALKESLKRQWYEQEQRMTDIMKHTYGTTLNSDVDIRPTLVYSSRQSLSGYDVDGTDSAKLGQFIGKSEARIQFKMPPRHFSEHGSLVIMCLPRFPFISEEEVDYQLTNLPYIDQQVLGNPAYFREKPPIRVNSDTFFNKDLVAYDTGGDQVPYGYWYQNKCNIVHPRYNGVAGFSTVDAAHCRTIANAIKPGNDTWDEVFQNNALESINMQANCSVHVKRVIPPFETSIFAGAD